MRSSTLALTASAALCLAAAGVGCAAPEFDVPVDFVVPQGHRSFDQLDTLQLRADYGDGRAWDFFLEDPLPESTWEVPSIPAGDGVRLRVEGLVESGLPGDAQIVVASGGAGPVAIGPDLPGVRLLFTRRGRMGTLPGALDTGRADPMIATLPDGSLLVLGGSRGLDDAGAPVPLDSGSRFPVDASEAAWTFAPVAPMRGARMDGRAVTIAGSGTAMDGKVVVFGTMSVIDRRSQLITAEIDPDELEEAQATGMPEVFDPADGSWADLRIDDAWEARAARSFFTATQIGQQLAVIGGVIYDNEGGLGLRVSAETWLIDLESGDVTESAPMGDTRWAHTATPLLDGRLLVVGGANVPTAQQTYPEANLVEAYDPLDGTWQSLGTLDPGRADQIAARLPDGRVLIAGGVTGIETVALTESWIFDPADDTFTPDAPMHAGRVRASAQVLGDGRVMVCGGEDAALAPVGGCEIWSPGAAGQVGGWVAAPDPSGAFVPQVGRVLASLPGGEAALVGGIGTDGAYSTDVLIVRP